MSPSEYDEIESVKPSRGRPYRLALVRQFCASSAELVRILLIYTLAREAPSGLSVPFSTCLSKASVKSRSSVQTTNSGTQTGPRSCAVDTQVAGLRDLAAAGVDAMHEATRMPSRAVSNSASLLFTQLRDPLGIDIWLEYGRLAQLHHQLWKMCAQTIQKKVDAERKWF
ncbi:hypothetical protein MKEN_01027700 [Mycena kentingensis (nom. inval.)]|nr:hypothetical protein MKEN_01027700 [Mycena kentingensis (nom. inval.)]